MILDTYANTSSAGSIIAFVIDVLAFGSRIWRADVLAHQITVGHPPNLDVQLGDIYGFNPDAVGIFPRQDHAASCKAHIGRLFAEGEVDVSIGRQGLTLPAR